MIRQICPNCFRPIELPDDAAGTTAPCPACGKAFPVPAGYVPSVSAERPPAPPPGYVPPRPEPEPKPVGETPDPAGQPDALATFYQRECVVVLSPQWVSWVPPVALASVLLLTFFAWVGAFPGDYRLVSQSPWQALLGTVRGDSIMPTKDLQALKEQTPANWELLLPYFALLLAAVVVAWADRLGANPDAARMPRRLGWVPRAWPHRLVLTTVLATTALVLVLMQSARGFGLETAIAARVEAAVTEAESKPGAPPVPYVRGEALGHWSPAGTTARDAAVVLHALAVGGLVAGLWFARRGSKPYPRLTATW